MTGNEQAGLETISSALYMARQALFRPDHVYAEDRKTEALDAIQEAENAMPSILEILTRATLYRNVLEEIAGVMQVASSRGDPDTMVDQAWLDRRIARINRALA